MKTKILITLAAICVAGLLVPAIAQTSNDAADSNNPAATPDESAAGGATDQAVAGQEAGPPEAAPGEAAAAPGGEAAAPAPSAVNPRAAAPGRGFNGGFNRGFNNAGGFNYASRQGYSPNAGATVTASSPFTPPELPVAGATNGLSMNFDRAPLSEVLTYLSDAAGFIIVLNVPSVYGTVSVLGKNLSKQDCVDLLNAQLNQNGYAAVFTPPRILTIMTKDAAKVADIPVISGTEDPNSVPVNDAMVTQIIPIRFVDAAQLVSDLSLFVNPQASIEANTAGNSIIITDTQADIHHLMKIIQAVDDSAQMETTVQTFPLKYASPVDVANELAEIFPSSNGGAQAPINVFGGPGGRGGFGGRGGGGFFGALLGAGAGGGGETTADRIQRSQQVNAVPDSRTQSVVVTAPKDLMDQIATLIGQLDVPSDRDQSTYVFSITNADPYVVAQELQGVFGSSGNNNQNQNYDLLGVRRQSAATQMGQVNPNSSGINNSGGGGGGFGGRGGATP